MIRQLTLVFVTGFAAVSLTAGSAAAWDVNHRNFSDVVSQLANVRGPTPQTEALAPLVGNFNLTGTIPARTLANDQPEMSSSGTHSCKWIMNNLFIECDVDDTAQAGEAKTRWMGHIVLGWDHQDKVYRGTIADSQGTIGLVQGNMKDNKLVLELVSKNTLGGQPFKYRISFDFTDPSAIKFSSEVKQGTRWIVSEKKVLRKTQ